MLEYTSKKGWEIICNKKINYEGFFSCCFLIGSNLQKTKAMMMMKMIKKNCQTILQNLQKKELQYKTYCRYFFHFIS